MTQRNIAESGSLPVDEVSANGSNDNAPRLTFKQADEPWEFEEISQLNYASFVEEVPQHPSNDAGVLVDRFHDENTYFICRRDRELVGMICVRDRRPFSLDEKLGSLEDYLPQAEGARVCEVRLLTVRPDMRRTRVLTGLLTMMARYCQEGGYDYVVMSGRVSQQALYRHIGFIPFGPVVGDDAAPYQPMYRPVGNVGAEFAGLFHDEVDAPPDEPVILTPGPVAMPDAVVRAFNRPPLSHRSPEFAALMQSVRRRLLALTNASHCAVMVGSGTLANDVVAAQLSRLDAPGVVVTAGEFGERLLDHANRMGPRYTAVRHEWGAPLDYDHIEKALSDAVDGQPAGWLWTTHCETSTGALADLPRLKAMCREHDVRLALDCISSIGATPVDLSDVWLASGASGKALAAYPGLGLVFSGYRPEPDATLPRYLDLGLHCAGEDSGAVPFTLSSNLLAALDAGLARQSEALLSRVDREGRWLRGQLRDLGFTLVAAEEESAGAVTTIALPPRSSTGHALEAQQMGRNLEAHGFYTSYASGYLRRRNWLQICLMGDTHRGQLERLLPVLAAQLDEMTRAGATT
ncbi:MAG: GNAT family N-acetyltransferase [Chloroflexota bacterium]|nr:GNAT family N-acetyltransferase [Chloroflexota bacterium]MDE2960974.1 GNAT family N-acetyltransferase [Chloroflexota bacterium]